MIEQAVILAAGRGVRLGPLTEDRPKAMLPVLGKPIVARVMDRIRDAGIKRFVVVVGEHEGAIAAYLNSSWHPEVEIKFVLQTEATGTADAIAAAERCLDGPFLLSSCDNLTPPGFTSALIERFGEWDGDMVIGLVRAPADEIRHSAAVTIDGDRVIGITEKPDEPQDGFAGILVYACGLRVLDYLKRVPVSLRGEREASQAVQMLIEDGGKVGYCIADWRLHMTTDLDLLHINRQLLREGVDAHILSEIPMSVEIVPPVRVDPGVSVGQGARLGPGVYLETGSVVGQNAVVEDSVILSGGIVRAGEQIRGQIISARHRASG